MKPNLKF